MQTRYPGISRVAAVSPIGLLLPAAACVALVFALGGCASTEAGKDEGTWKDTAVAAVSQQMKPEAGGSSAPASAPKPAGPPSRDYFLDKEDVGLWRDPGFKRQFTESYLAETDVEPVGKLTEKERKQMQQILKKMSDNDTTGAAALVEASRGKDANPVFDFTAGNIYFQGERLDNAIQAYKVAVAKHPRFRRAWRNLGLIYIRQKDYDHAIPALTRVVELGGVDANTYGLLAFAYSASTFPNHIGAETAYRMAILLDPATLDWKMGLARSFYRQARYAEAVASLDKLIADHPDRAELWQLQASAYIGLNQPLKAAENYELLDRMGKSTPDSLILLGNIYVNEEIYDQAVGYFIRALDNDTKAAGRYIVPARVLASRGALKEAKTLAERIEARKGDQLTAEDRKGLLKLRHRIAVSEGAGPEEARVLEETLTLDPMDGEALILLGQYRGRMGDKEKAIFYFERAEAIKAFEADALLRHAQLLVKLKEYGKAVPLLERAQKVNRRDNVEQFLNDVKRAAKTG